MTGNAPSKRPRGRPSGTRKREHAVAAAEAIRAGEYDDVYEAALAFYHAHIRSKLPTPTMAEAMQSERYRDFVKHVIEALKETLPIAEWRTLNRVLSRRNSHARIRQSRNSIRIIRAGLLPAEK